MDHHIDEVGVLEGGRALVVGLRRDLPRRRPCLPDEPADRATIALEANAAALSVEVALIPERALALRRCGRGRAEDILDRVAADEHRRPDAIGMKLQDISARIRHVVTSSRAPGAPGPWRSR